MSDTNKPPSEDLLILTLRVLPMKLADGTTWGAGNRIKAMLKVLLRRFGMRLVNMQVSVSQDNVKKVKDGKP